MFLHEEMPLIGETEFSLLRGLGENKRSFLVEMDGVRIKLEFEISWKGPSLRAEERSGL